MQGILRESKLPEQKTGRENSQRKGPEVETCWVFKGSMSGPVWLEGGGEGKKRGR